jgi:Domain of unknown function (DUF4258)
MRAYVATIRTICDKFRRGEYEIAIPHFFEEMAEDGFAFGDVEAAMLKGKIRRRFTDDPRGTRYEVVGKLADGRQLAVVCRIKATGRLLLITCFAPEED